MLPSAHRSCALSRSGNGRIPVVIALPSGMAALLTALVFLTLVILSAGGGGTRAASITLLGLDANPATSTDSDGDGDYEGNPPSSLIEECRDDVPVGGSADIDVFVLTAPNLVAFYTNLEYKPLGVMKITGSQTKLYINAQPGSNVMNLSEHVALAPTCFDGVDNDGDGSVDEADIGCQPFADFDGDGFPNVAEELLGSDPNNADSTPEHSALAPTCFDGVDNDGDGFTDTADPGCQLFLDSDDDGFLDRLEVVAGSDPENPASTPEVAPLPGACDDGLDNDLDGLVDGEDPGCGLTVDDSDGDGFPDSVELHLGSDPASAESTPEHILLPHTCNDSVDNDGDGAVDFQDPGCLILDADGDGDLNYADADDDNDSFTDVEEVFVGTLPAVACAATPTANDEASDASPTDNNDDQMTKLDDVLRYIPVFNSTAPSPPYDERYDLNADGKVTLADVLRFIPSFNRSCTP